jgi:hypothetical protein
VADENEKLLPDEQRPRRECLLAWQYLMDRERMVRMVETLDLYDVRRGRQTVELDVAMPYVSDQKVHMLIPAVFLNKRPVAHDLEVRAADGSMVSVPTKHENQELTLAALDELHAQGIVDLDVHPEMRAIVGDIVCKRPVVAEVAGVQLRRRVGEIPPPLSQLLEILEEKFLLWIPVEGDGGGTHYFSIQRRLHREIEPIIPRKTEEVEVEFEMAVGPTAVAGPSAIGRRTVRPLECFERMLRILGLAPIQVAQEITEACRVDSYHARVRSPQDFVVRDVRLARILPNRLEPNDPRLEELESEPNQVIQGHDSELAHVNCVRREDPTPMLLEVLLGIRDGLTTLWTLGVMMTAVLLWIFKSDPDPAVEGGHLEVAAAVLLLGPALAAAWAVRSDEGDLLRTVLSGTRQLLMGSALLSVAAALALIGYAPGDMREALDWYALASYAIAVVVVVSWSITRQTPWVFYRHLINSPRRNLLATAMLSLLAAGIIVHDGLPAAATGPLMLLIGLGLAVISANRAGCAMGSPKRSFAPLAGLAATVVFLTAGASLGYYGDVLALDPLRPVACGIEVALALLSFLILPQKDYERPIL